MAKKKPTTLRFFKPAAQAPMPSRAQRECVVDIERLSAEGRGLGFWEGKPVFVAGALPGERVRARVHTDKREWREAELIEVQAPAPARAAAPCELFGRCGGCQLQMLPYAAQVAHKQQVLERLLAPFAASLQWQEPLLAEAFAYRHRARLSVGRDAAGKPLLGFKSAHSHDVVAVPACPVLDRRLQALLRQLPAWLEALPHWQRIREIVIAVDAQDRLAMACDAQPPLALADRELLEGFAREADVAYGKNLEPLHYAIPGQHIDFLFLPKDFTQVNPAINDRLVTLCLQWLEPAPDDRIADFFCGLGNFSLALARRAGTVTGLESVAEMVARAGANAARLGLDHARFQALDLFDETPALPPAINKAVLDPPRAGAKALCRQLASVKTLERVVYVSCNPQTLARDLAMLAEGGLLPRRAALVDMFPQTGHSEAVVLLSR